MGGLSPESASYLLNNTILKHNITRCERNGRASYLLNNTILKLDSGFKNIGDGASYLLNNTILKQVRLGG